MAARQTVKTLSAPFQSRGWLGFAVIVVALSKIVWEKVILRQCHSVVLIGDDRGRPLKQLLKKRIVKLSTSSTMWRLRYSVLLLW